MKLSEIMLIFKPGMFFPKHNFLNTNYYKAKIFCQWGFNF